jgi:hypothetical protein
LAEGQGGDSAETEGLKARDFDDPVFGAKDKVDEKVGERCHGLSALEVVVRLDSYGVAIGCFVSGLRPLRPAGCAGK